MSLVDLQACGVPCPSHYANKTFTCSCFIRPYNDISDECSYEEMHYNIFLALALPTSRSSGGVSNSASLLGKLEPASFLETCQVTVCTMMFSWLPWLTRSESSHSFGSLGSAHAVLLFNLPGLKPALDPRARMRWWCDE